MDKPEHETYLHKTVIVISHTQISGSQKLTVDHSGTEGKKLNQLFARNNSSSCIWHSTASLLDIINASSCDLLPESQDIKPVWHLKIHALLLNAAANGPGKSNCSHGTEGKKHSQTKGNVYQTEWGDPGHKCTECLWLGHFWFQWLPIFKYSFSHLFLGPPLIFVNKNSIFYLQTEPLLTI